MTTKVSPAGGSDRATAQRVARHEFYPGSRKQRRSPSRTGQGARPRIARRRRGLVAALGHRAGDRRRLRSDKEWGLTDCISFALMKQEGIAEALTADAHFRQAGCKALLLESS